MVGAWTCVSCRKFHRRHGFVKYPFTSAVPNDAAGKYHRNCRWYNCCCRYAGFGVRTALYSIVAVFVTSKVMDGVTSGMRYAKIMYIISDQSAEIAEIILHQFERGVTALRGNGMYSGKEKQILMCVVSRREAVSMVKYVKEADERAFVIVADAREVLGKGLASVISMLNGICAIYTKDF